MIDDNGISLECFDEMCRDVLDKAKEAIEFAENMNLTNDQHFLNFLDALNEYSVRY